MASDDDDHPPSTQAPWNLGIRLPEIDAAPRASTPTTLAEAYALACEHMASTPPTAAGYRLFWVRYREVGWMDLPSGGAYAVIGRHGECDVKLRENPEISLRHLLATTVRLADGLALRILDLQTNIPFSLADGLPRRSIAACGPMALRLGDYVIGGVPIEEDPTQAGKLRLPLGELPRAMVTESNALPLSVRPAPAPRPAAPAPRKQSASPWALMDDPISHITSMPPSMPIGERTASRAPLAKRASTGNDLEDAMLDELGREGPGCAWVTLRRDGQSAAVELSEGELDLGVLVGRSEHCHDGLKAVLDTNVSRGHLLLLHHHEVFEAFDLCSTQGTFTGGKRVRRVVLSDQGAAIQLATKSPVVLEWKRSG